MKAPSSWMCAIGPSNARERIPQARNFALSEFDKGELPRDGANVVLFHCKSGMRTLSNAQALSDKAGEACDAFIVEGGIDAWRKAGLPVVEDKSQPLDLMRQVQIGAGSLGFFGTLAGIFIAPGFLIIPAFVGAGLMVGRHDGFLRSRPRVDPHALEQGAEEPAGRQDGVSRTVLPACPGALPQLHVYRAARLSVPRASPFPVLQADRSCSPSP